MKIYSPKILVTGSNGQLGTCMREHPSAQDVQLIACTRAELDITNVASIEHALATHAPDVIINTAAYTAVDKAEQEPDECRRINHVGAKNLAIACQQRHIPLIHVSTDYVFSGTQTSAYQENDIEHPPNQYGMSKWLGEQAIQQECEKHIILRVSGAFSRHGNNFAKTIVRLAKERKQLCIVADQITCPTHAVDIAGVLFKLAQQPTYSGIYHYCSTNPVSWHHFAAMIIATAQQKQSLMVEEITAITTAEYPTAAQRPAYSVLDCGKIKKYYGVEQPSWQDALTTVVADIL